MQKAIIVDIDGTLSEKCDRDIYDYNRVTEDFVVVPIYNIVRTFHHNGYHIIYVTGRKEDSKDVTYSWFIKNNIPYDLLYMRKDNDNRQDAIIKEEIYNKYIKDKYDVLFCLEDRNRVVDMWRRIGLTCLQVRDGDY